MAGMMVFSMCPFCDPNLTISNISQRDIKQHKNSIAVELYCNVCHSPFGLLLRNEDVKKSFPEAFKIEVVKN